MTNDQAHQTPLFEAACQGRVEIAHLLIERGASVNTIDIVSWWVGIRSLCLNIIFKKFQEILSS